MNKSFENLYHKENKKKSKLEENWRQVWFLKY